MSEPPKCFTIKTPKAIKDHKCCECRGTIFKGETYHLFSGIWDTAESFKTCSECEALRSDVEGGVVNPDTPAFGELYEHVFESDNREWIKRYMGTRRKRNAPESPRRWMEEREQELDDALIGNANKEVG